MAAPTQQQQQLLQVFPIQRWRNDYGNQVDRLVDDAKKAYTKRNVQTSRDYNHTFCSKCAYCVRFFKPEDCASVVAFHRQARKPFIRCGWGSYFDNYILGFVEAAPPKSKDGHAKHICDECITRKLDSGALKVVYVPAVGYVTNDTGCVEPTTDQLLALIQQFTTASK